MTDDQTITEPIAPPAETAPQESAASPATATEMPPEVPPSPPGAPPSAEEPPAEEPLSPPPSNKRWYIVKVQSGREDTIKEAIERKVKIEGLEEFFGQIIIPTETVTEVRNNKRVK